MPVELVTRNYGGPDSTPHLLITAGVHGDEFEPMAAVRRLLSLFEANDPQVAGLNGHVTLVPCVNEAAFLRGHRTADDGLDLARICPGNPNGSITEQTGHALSELIRSADYYIDLHTGGTEMSVYPLAGYSIHDDQQILETQRRMARAFNLPVVWGTSGKLQGRSLSIARDARIPAIYTEHHGAARCDPHGTSDYVTGCLNVMAELGMIDRELPASRVRHFVEDGREGAGHMQICNPSPIDGFFEPAVELGETVRTGEVLGTVVDLTGSDRHELKADADGIMLVLRTFPRVRKGESVGVVMEFV